MPEAWTAGGLTELFREQENQMQMDITRDGSIGKAKIISTITIQLETIILPVCLGFRGLKMFMIT